MNKFFKILIFMVIGIVFIFGSLGAYLSYKSAKYSETAVPYIKEKIPELSTWKFDVAKSLLAPSIREQTKDEDLKKILKWFSKLGQLEKIDEPQFVKVSKSATTEYGNQTIATYTIHAYYENGDAIITMGLLEVENGYGIFQFHLSSAALIE